MYHIIVRTKYQEILNSFLKSFLETTKDFNTKLYVVYRESDHIVIPKIENVIPVPSMVLGEAAYIPILMKIFGEVKITTRELDYGYFGILNDDLLFSKDWLIDVDKALKLYESVTPGYINTTDRDKFYRAVEKSKDEIGIVPLGMGGCIFGRINIFPRIGMLDPQFDWACGDFDFYWRLRLNGMKSVTLKKITIAHGHGASRTKDLQRWNKESDEGKQKFYNKHGYVSYRILRAEYKGHDYFLNYDC